MDTVTIVLLVRQILVMQQYIYHLSFLLHFVRFTEDKCSYIVRFYKFDIIYEKFLLIVRYEASEFVFFFSSRYETSQKNGKNAYQNN